jgi:cell division protein FtsB
MNKILVVLKNKYIITCVLLIGWVLFFDKNDLRTLMKMKKEVSQLEEEKNYYTREIAKIAFELSELTTNMPALEKFAREKYLMKKDNEDLFVIVTK